MNADHDLNDENVQDRFNLVASEHNLRCALASCKFPTNMVQVLMPGDPSVPINEFQKEFIGESSCMVCKEIPLKPKECYNCNKLICFICELKLTYSNGLKVAQRACPNCKAVEIKNAELNEEDESGKPRARESKKGPGDLVSKPIFQEI